jgi:hypothetical protein
MNITLLGASFTDDEAVLAVKYQLGNFTSAIPENIVRKMISHWRTYKRDGMSDNWILAEMKKQKVAIGGMVMTQGGAFPVLTDNQISNFVTAMKRISSGDMPGNPWERMTWGSASSTSHGELLRLLSAGRRSYTDSSPARAREFFRDESPYPSRRRHAFV